MCKQTHNSYTIFIYLNPLTFFSTIRLYLPRLLSYLCTTTMSLTLNSNDWLFGY